MKIAETLSYQFQHPPFQPISKDICLVRLSKITGNLLYKTMIAVAIVVETIASPLFWAVDYSRKTDDHEWKEMKIPTLVEFYSGQVNDRGASLEQIWNWDDSRLEAQHDFIQWLFPIMTKGVNPTAPPTNATTIQVFKQDKTLQRKMIKSLEVMLAFYGFTRDKSGAIQIGANFSEQAKNWLNPGNHNYRRITRILKSLSLHGLNADAKGFFHALQEVYDMHSDQIGKETFEIWKSAKD